MNQRLRDAWRFFAAMNGQVGRHALVGMDMARAELRAQDCDAISIEWECDEWLDLSWDETGETARKIDAGEWTCEVCIVRYAGEVRASLGGIIVDAGEDAYRRYVEAELADEAFSEVDELRARAVRMSVAGYGGVTV